MIVAFFGELLLIVSIVFCLEESLKDQGNGIESLLFFEERIRYSFSDGKNDCSLSVFKSNATTVKRKHVEVGNLISLNYKVVSATLMLCILMSGS